VLLVVFYHFWPNRLSGGYIGVDVFFVISGFLITGQLTRELRSRARIALPDFWARRVRRLVPASLLVLFVSLLLVTFVMPLAYLPESLRDVGASSLYVQNWSLAVNSVDYLASSSRTIAEHYWSLSLEEQFYVVWPLVLLGTFSLAVRWGVRRRWVALAVTIIILGALSFVASVWYTAVNPAQAYFVLFTRIWEFAAGALLVLWGRRAPRVWQSNVLGYAGIAVVLASAVLLDRSSAFPGWLAIFPVAGTIAILAMGSSRRWWNASGLLSLRPVRFVGDISYSLYLWHWPLIVIAPFVAGWGLSIVNRIALFVLCFVLAWLTKRFVEDPMRRLPYLTSRKPRFTFGWMLVAIGVMGALLVGSFAVQFPKYQAASAQLAEVAVDPPECFGAAVLTGCENPELDSVIIPEPGFGNADRPGNGECFVQLNDANVVACQFGSEVAGAPRIALIGDSHAYQYIDAMIAQAEKNGWSLTTYLKGGCPWTTTEIGGTNPAFTASCNAWHAGLAEILSSAPPFDAIVTTGLTSNLIESAGSPSAAVDGLVGAWAAQAQGSPVIALSDNPVPGDDPNKCLRYSDASECDVSREIALPGPDIFAEAARAHEGAHSLDFSSLFCDETRCAVVIGGADVYRDQDHLTATFANTLGPFIAEKVESVLSRR
jgi:peptidoglycan/LPS O-acetylase OafA/YrhL